MHLGIRLRLAIPCPSCGCRDGHYDNCPVLAIQCLQSRQKWLPCPLCSLNQVDRNDRDLWECRSCHSQFLTKTAGNLQAPVEVTGEKFGILDENADEAYFVMLVKEKGQGKFSIDCSIAEFEEQIAKAREARDEAEDSED